MRQLQPNTSVVYCTCLVRKVYKCCNKISVLAKTNEHTTFDSVPCCDENNRLENKELNFLSIKNVPFILLFQFIFCASFILINLLINLFLETVLLFFVYASSLLFFMQ